MKKRSVLLPVSLFGFLSLQHPAYTQDFIYPADAVVNVCAQPYEAKPDDGVDDTAALQKAISDSVETGRFLYFPAGVYEISDTLLAKNSKGIWRAQLTLHGQARDKTIIRLKDEASGFGDPSAPKAMLMTGSHWQEGDSAAGGGNKAFRNNIFQLTFDTGSHNPGAIGIEYAVSNHGAIKDVRIRSGDGAGVAGISMRRKIPGPGLIQRVEIDGFDIGLDLGDIQYGVVLEDVAVRNQRRTGIRIEQNLLHARNLRSENRVPAIEITRLEGVLTLIDSELIGGEPTEPAIRADGTVFLRNVKLEGYNAAPLIWRGAKYERNVFQAWCGPDMPAWKDGLLEVRDSPEYWNANLSDWEPVGARNPGEQDDTLAIQRAIDSGKSTIYFPPGRTYFLSDTVVIRGGVRQILGMGSEISLGAAREAFSNMENPRPLFRIDPTGHRDLFLEHLFLNAQYPGGIVFENHSPADVIIRHCGGWVGGDGIRRSYRNSGKGTGRLFLEDVFLPGWEFNGQEVWARQFNPENYESDGSRPQVWNRGGKLWILGFKTEGAAPFISTTESGVTELLGAYNYISATASPKVPASAIPYIIDNSSAALNFATDNFRDNDYPVYIRFKTDRETRDWTRDDLTPRNGRRGDRSLAVPWFRVPSSP